MEGRARDARVLAVATEGDEQMRDFADDILWVPETIEELSPVLAVIPLQLFAYHTAVARGTDVDQPRNLAKSVTVEYKQQYVRAPHNSGGAPPPVPRASSPPGRGTSPASRPRGCACDTGGRRTAGVRWSGKLIGTNS